MSWNRLYYDAVVGDVENGQYAFHPRFACPFHDPRHVYAPPAARLALKKNRDINAQIAFLLPCQPDTPITLYVAAHYDGDRLYGPRISRAPIEADWWVEEGPP
jgi:hypothetical protein